MITKISQSVLGDINLLIVHIQATLKPHFNDGERNAKFLLADALRFDMY